MERFLFLGLIIITVGNYRDAAADKPIMIPRGDELVIQEGTKLELKCYSKEARIQFSFPEYAFMSPRSNYTISTDNNGTSTFLRPNTVALDTGWYACAAEDVKIENNFKNLNHTHENIAWIYIYVNSSTSFADRYYTFPKSISVSSGQPAIVPCRPTSPLSNIQLWQNSSIVQQSEEIRFDPRIGFIIEQLVFQDLVIHFHCEIDGDIDRYDLYYSRATGPKPRIWVQDISYAKELWLNEGDLLMIECWGKSGIQFFFPNTHQLTFEDYVTETSKFGILDILDFGSSFLRESTISSDTGWYGCAEKGINSDIPYHNYIDYTRTEINWIYVYVKSNFRRMLEQRNDLPGDTWKEADHVRFVDGSDIKIPCRPIYYSDEVTLDCSDPVEDKRFDPKYGFIVKRELNFSMICCKCVSGSYGHRMEVCSLEVSEKQRESFVKSEHLMLMTGEDLRLSYAKVEICNEENYNPIKLGWSIPPTVSMNRVEQTISTSRSINKWHTIYGLKLKNVTVQDSGEYGMKMTDNDPERTNPIEVLVLDRGSWEYTKLNLQENEYTFVCRVNESFKLMVDLQSFSSGTIRWLDPSKQEIEQTETFHLDRSRFYFTCGLRSLLVINCPTFHDDGAYRAEISTPIGTVNMTFTFNAEGPLIAPRMEVKWKESYYVLPDEPFHDNCCSDGWPRPSITWTFLKQPKYPSNNDSTLAYLTAYKQEVKSKTTVCSYLNINIDAVGILNCIACNSINCSTATRQVFILDSGGPFGIIGPNERQSFLGDNITLKCTGSIHWISKLEWKTNLTECYKNGKLQNPDSIRVTFRCSMCDFEQCSKSDLSTNNISVSHETFRIEESETRFTRRAFLHIQNATECHQRSYSCVGVFVDDQYNTNVQVATYGLKLIVPKKPYFIDTNLNRREIILDAELDHAEMEKLFCITSGKPRPNITWFKNGIQIKQSGMHKFISEIDPWQLIVTLDLRNGHNRRYTCKAINRFGEIEDYIDFIIEVPPITSIINGTQPYFAVPNKYFNVTCCAIGVPLANFTGTFSKQPEYPLERGSSLAFPSMHEYVIHNRTTVCSNLLMNTSTIGILTCEACNYINCSIATRRVFLSDSVGRFGTVGPEEQLYFGDNVTLTCAGSIHAFAKLWWEMDFDECYENEKMFHRPNTVPVSHKTFYVEDDPTKLTLRNFLRMENVTECHRRSYSCSGRTIDGNTENTTYDLRLSIPKRLHFTRTSLNGSKITLNALSDDRNFQRLTCCADGEPSPNVMWLRDGFQIEENDEHKFFPNSCELAVIPDLSDGYDRRYTCRAENRLEKIEDHIDFIIEGKNEKRDKILSITIRFTFILIGVAIGGFVARKLHKKRSRRKFKAAILARFEEGALNYLRLNVNMADQAEVLPFDKKFEYPRKLLKFDKLLGSGAFGIVRKAEAKSICRGEKTTIVAVKMVRATHRLHYMTALIRELKVLVHLGSHLNIVNLLGACTKNLSYGELLVIVEFCRFGNLHDYLFERRSDFIDQIDPVTKKIIDPNLKTDRVNIGYNRDQVTCYNDHSETENTCRITDTTNNDANTSDKLLVNGLVQPGLRCDYRNDDPDLIKESISTKDLLCWVWQVTRGMRYLGLRKVVHGDLAARNVLLADNNVIKICDFGLAEILYKDEDYNKLAEDVLPLQWMAIESLRDRVFSAKSDVWSFGILLWEFFTLAETPYYGVNPRHLYEKLSSGYRLSQPKYAPDEIYRMMTDCWNAKPDQRPSFLKLDLDIGIQLDNGIHTYYTDMSPLYTEMSNEFLETGKIDYLTMDPSQLKKVSISTRQQQDELGDIPLDEFHDSARPSTSYNQRLDP